MNVWQLEVPTVLQRNFGFKFHSSVATAQNAGREINVDCLSSTSVLKSKL